MAFLTKDYSLVNRFIFPAPCPPTYSASSLPEIIWIPGVEQRARGGRRRSPDVPTLIPCALLRNAGSEYLVIFFHGNGEDLGGSILFCRDLIDALWSTCKLSALVVEYPGYGIYKGVANESGVIHAGNAAFRFARDMLQWPAENIWLFGVSIGSGPAVHIASSGNQVGGLLLLAAYESIREVVKHLIGGFAGMLIADRFRNAAKIHTVVCPSLFIHGVKDDLIPYMQSMRLFERCPAEHKHIVLVNDVAHVNFDLYEDIVQPIREFVGRIRLDRKLAGGSWPVPPNLCSARVSSMISAHNPELFSTKTKPRGFWRWLSPSSTSSSQDRSTPDSYRPPPFSTARLLDPIVISEGHFDVVGTGLSRDEPVGQCTPTGDHIVHDIRSTLYTPGTIFPDYPS